MKRMIHAYDCIGSKAPMSGFDWSYPSLTQVLPKYFPSSCQVLRCSEGLGRTWVGLGNLSPDRGQGGCLSGFYEVTLEVFEELLREGITRG